MRALLYLIVSLLAASLVFYSLGSPFAAALEVIIYVGAIMVLFVFVMMMLNPGPIQERQEEGLFSPGIWIGPSVLSFALLIELLLLLMPWGEVVETGYAPAGPKAVGYSLFGPYLIGVELASFLLLAAIVGAFHLGRKDVEGEGG